jgi:hypothetical protein
MLIQFDVWDTKEKREKRFDKGHKQFVLCLLSVICFLSSHFFPLSTFNYNLPDIIESTLQENEL